MPRKLYKQEQSKSINESLIEEIAELISTLWVMFREKEFEENPEDVAEHSRIFREVKKQLSGVLKTSKKNK